MASSPAPRSHSRASFYSTTTYHSFQDIELYEPGSQPEASGTSSARSPTVPAPKEAPIRRSRPSRRDDFDRRPSSFQMVRQDSGYESSTPVPHTFNAPKRQRNPPKQTSSSPSRAAKRPSLRRSATTKPGGPISHLPARTSLNINRPASLSQQQQQQQQDLNRKHSYFQFPSPENLDGQEQPSLSARPSVDLAPVILKVNTANANSNNPSDPDPSSDHAPYPSSPVPSPAVPPPQTTHYWTSDRTRKLEYAAIDAASRGVRGWVMRNVVPECLIPRASRRVGFEDDGGSVRRYRLELEIECPEDAVPPSPVGEKPRGFRARGARTSWWARLRGCVL